jgi:hypothetical protein
VTEARSACWSVLTALARINGKCVLQALSSIGVQVETMPKVGRLIRMGMEKLERAIDSLFQLLGSDAINEIKEKVQEVWTKAQTGEYTDQTLKWMFGVPKTQALAAQVPSSHALKQESLDVASNTLAELGVGFKEKMAWARGLATAAGFGSTVLTALTVVSAPSAALFTASVYLLIIAAILLIARNYAGESSLLNLVDGVKAIVQGML